MSKQQKALNRLRSAPKDFSWDELVQVMTFFGLDLKTSNGSARRFVNPVSRNTFYIHQPHPSNILKPYQIREALKFLRQEEFLHE